MSYQDSRALPPADQKSITVFRCARCGADHRLLFRRFNGDPIEDSDDKVWDWWAFCPVTGDPILLYWKPSEVTGAETDG